MRPKRLISLLVAVCMMIRSEDHAAPVGSHGICGKHVN